MGTHPTCSFVGHVFYRILSQVPVKPALMTTIANNINIGGTDRIGG